MCEWFLRTRSDTEMLVLHSVGAALFLQPPGAATAVLWVGTWTRRVGGCVCAHSVARYSDQLCSTLPQVAGEAPMVAADEGPGEVATRFRA